MAYLSARIIASRLGPAKPRAIAWNGAGGWLIFSLPPAEVGVHPTDTGGLPSGTHRISLMCDDIEQTIAELEAKGVTFTGPVRDQGYGLVTTIGIPGAGRLDLYQPRYPLPPSA